MLKFFTIISSVLFLSNIAFSQTFAGKIMDERDKPIVAANILNTTQSIHAHSDENGNFTLQDTQLGDTLKVIHLGFEMKTLVVSSLDAPLNIVMKSKLISLEEVVIVPNIDALSLISKIDLQTNPVNSSQDILRKVPGLFIGQHAGGGKAEQIFLRGFDIDHGTDIALSVDGMPVNMVSHAHGQGYSDLHFVIPETVDRIDFGKGPYQAENGNFNTAGFVDFRTKSSIEQNLIKTEIGQFDSQRLLGMFNVVNTNKQEAYVAAEYISTDGPFDSPQDFSRINLLGKYAANINKTDKIGFTTSYFTSEWDASGQVPVRAVEDGTIGRFGAIDDTEGGQTSRTNFAVNYDKRIDSKSTLKTRAFYSNYKFELYSNFTFFLEDSINGDQIMQKENRDVFGVSSTYQRQFYLGDNSGNWRTGVKLRNDWSHGNELSHTKNRNETLEQIQSGNIEERNVSAFADVTFNFGKWTINPAARVDYFDFNYDDNLVDINKNKSETEAIFSPKLNILFNPNQNVQLYLKGGKGFHSNDTRVVVARNGNEILPAAYGSDLGVIWKPTSRLFVNAALWCLFLEQEFVYVGDAGIVEPSGRTQRQGIDLSMRYQVTDWLFWNFDANYTYARSINEPEGMDYIPLAPDFTLASGLNAVHKSGIYGGAHLRYLDNRPANEDNSIVAEGYTVVDLNLGYTWKQVDFSIQIQNLFNTEWNETQFATESRLENETESVEEIHFTPGTPFFAKAVVTYKF